MTETSSGAVLLDTCALIWFVAGDPMRETALAAIVAAREANGIFVSVVSAWEIGLLSRPRPDGRQPVQFLPDPKAWFASAMARPSIVEARLTDAMAIDASHLPGTRHGDPGDRLIIATARHLALPIVTRDPRIIAYGQAGFVDVIAC